MNQLVISGTVAELKGQRYSPAGIPHFRFLLEHRSRQEQVGVPREVKCRLEVEARGDQLTQPLMQLQVGDRVEVTGFLARQNYKDSSATYLILHAQKIDW